ncbi:MAG: hypothetical protein ACYS5V_12715 [Planctomycetota bacterium]|jgi:hypothetical protein
MKIPRRNFLASVGALLAAPLAALGGSREPARLVSGPADTRTLPEPSGLRRGNLWKCPRCGKCNMVEVVAPEHVCECETAMQFRDGKMISYMYQSPGHPDSVDIVGWENWTAWGPCNKLWRKYHLGYSYWTE